MFGGALEEVEGEIRVIMKVYMHFVVEEFAKCAKDNKVKVGGGKALSPGQPIVAMAVQVPKPDSTLAQVVDVFSAKLAKKYQLPKNFKIGSVAQCAFKNPQGGSLPKDKPLSKIVLDKSGKKMMNFRFGAV